MQDYINLLILLLAYAIVSCILIGISVFIVNYLDRASKIENARIQQRRYQKIS